MTTLPQPNYRDPLDVLLRAEAETCKGCQHLDRVGSKDYCANPLVRSPLAGRRCDEYEEHE